MKKINWTQLLICILIPLAVGGLAAFLTQNNMKAFGSINQPPLTPPAWLFPVAWTILYTLMGVSYGILDVNGVVNSGINTIYYIQLFYIILVCVLY